jgi:RNA polymerase sigma-70 factor, ECF subfamily
MERRAVLKSVPVNHEGPRESPGAHLPSARSFDDIYTRHFPFVWRCLRGLGVPRGALDDAAQDVFLVVHRQLAGFRGESSPQTWLYGIARHVAANHQRRTRRKQEPLEPLLSEPPHPDPGPHERAADAEAAAFVETFVAGLNDKRRDIFILAVLEEMTIPEVAVALSIPVNTAYTRLRAVRAEFERAIGRHRP